MRPNDPGRRGCPKPISLLLFTIRIGSDLLAVPALTGSVGYDVAKLANWPEGIAKRDAKRSRLIQIYSDRNASRCDLGSVCISSSGFFWSAVLNGVCAGLIMVLVMLMTTDKAISGDLQFPQPQRILGWTSTPGRKTGTSSLLGEVLR